MECGIGLMTGVSSEVPEVCARREKFPARNSVSAQTHTRIQNRAIGITLSKQETSVSFRRFQMIDLGSSS